MIKKITICLLVIMALLVIFPAVVLAIADPDSPPKVPAVYVYQDLLEDGDAGILVEYYLDYAVNPDENVTEAYLVIFIDTDGTTQLKAVAPYTYQDDGYGQGLAWVYFTAAEVTTLGIDEANEALYRVWLTGNPTLTWVGDPPKTIASVDSWTTSDDGSIATLFALRVLTYADILELAWSIDLIEDTPLGSRLTTAGEAYFTNVIQSLRQIAPACFSAGEFDPTLEDIDYTTEFGATMTNGTGTVIGSPITLAEGANVVNVTVAGTFTLQLERGTEGTVANGTGTVNGSPVDIVYGLNTITVPGGGTGTLTVTVTLVNTQSNVDDTIIGTGLDLTTVATLFGMSRAFFSGIVWIGITVIICAAVYRMGQSRSDVYIGGERSGKAVLLVFNICIIGGGVLGLLPVLVAVLMFIGSGALTGYVLFYRGANV